MGGQQAADVWEALQEAVEDDRPAVLFTRKGGDGGAPLLVYPEGEVVGNWGALTEGAVVEAKEAYAQRRNWVVELAGEAVFVQVLARRQGTALSTRARMGQVQFACRHTFVAFLVSSRPSVVYV